MAIEGPKTDTYGPSLPILSSKRLPHSQPIIFPFAAYSSPHDLLAVAITNNDIGIFRITSGQVAFTVKRDNAAKKGIEVASISWKADATCLGVGWSDGKYGIYDGGSGKQLALTELSAGDGEIGWRLSLLRPDEDEGEEDQKKKATADGEEAEGEEGIERVYAKAEVIGWMSHDANGHLATEQSEQTGALTTEQWFDGLDGDEPSLSVKSSEPKLTQLSRAITTLDVTKALPRLSAVQNHMIKPAKSMGKTQKLASVWQTQQGTDSIFDVGRDLTTKGTVESLLVCQDDGTVQVLIDETVRVGSCNVPGKPLLHVAHHNCPGHAILSQTEDSAYHLSTIDLPLSTLSGPLLHVIATNTKRLQTLLDYIVQTIRCIQFDYNHNIEIPTRYLRSLGGFVEDSDLPDVVANFYHLAMTGTFPEPLLEWYKDVLSERGQKRWDEHISNMYRHIQDHLFMNLLPALDRFSIAATTLRGHATFYESSSKFDCPPKLFTKVLDQIDCLRLVAQKMLSIVQTEHRQFRAFNKWMRMQIEIANAEPFTASALETESREVPSLDYSMLLGYVRDIVTESKLAVHIKNRPGMEGEVESEEFWSNDIVQQMTYELSKEVLQREQDPSQQMSLSLKDVNDHLALLNLPAITCSLTGHVRVVLQKITDWQSRMLSTPVQIPLGINSDSTIHDMAMTDTSGSPTTQLLLSHPSDPNQIALIRASTAALLPTITLPLPPATELLAVKWIRHTHATSFLALARVLLDDGETFHTEVRRHTLSPTQTESHPELLHVFPGNASFKPQTLLVGGRKGKMVCVVFGNKGREWRVLDLSAEVQFGGPARETGEEDGMDMSEF